MRGGGRRRSNGGGSGKSKSRSPGQSTRPNDNSAAGSSSGGRRRRTNTLFVEGGILSDFRRDPTFSTPSRGGSSSGKGSKPRSSDRAKAFASTSGPRKCSYVYQYPSMDFEEGLDRRSGVEVDQMDGSNAMVLGKSEATQIVAYLDQTPSSSKEMKVNYDYEYEPSFVLGDESHRGLGFCDDSDAAPSGSLSVTKALADPGGSTFGSFGEETAATEDEVMPDVVKLSKRNSGFISIGGMKLYTEDISEEESGGEEGINDDDESGDEGSTEETGSSESDS